MNTLDTRPPPGWLAPFFTPSLIDALANNATDKPEATALMDVGRQRSVSNQELLSLSLQAAGCLKDTKAHGTIALIADTSVDAVAVIIGAWMAGFAVAALNPRDSHDRLIHHIREADADLLVLDDLSLAEALNERLPTAIPAETPHGLAAGDALLSPSRVESMGFSPDPGLIIFSSGTTGISKGCILSHGYLTWSSAEFVRVSELQDSETVFGTSTPFHINLYWSMGAAILSGGTYAFRSRLSVSALMSDLASSRATVWNYPGVSIRMTLSRGVERPPDLGTRTGVGGALTREDIDQFERQYGITLIDCYGLTECTLPIFQTAQNRKLGSVGRPSDYFQVRLVGPDGPVEGVGSGELQIKAPHWYTRFSGYSSPEATRLAYSDEWFRTRDVLRRDSDGYFHFVGRADDVIRRRGENIGTRDVESVAAQYPGVIEVAAIGLDSPVGDQEIGLVVSTEGPEVNAAELLRWTSERLPDHMQPFAVALIDEFPRTDNGRIRRSQLRDSASRLEWQQ